MSTTQTRTITSAATGTVDITYSEQGEGRPFLLLHGGAGPQSVVSFADLLAGSHPARVLVPTHPGFGATARPDGLNSVGGLAAAYAALLDELELSGVTVIGNSLGGWIAAELALLHSPRISGVVILDAVGLQLDGAPIADFFSLTMDQVTDLSYFEPERFRTDFSALPDAARAIMAGNRAALAVYGGTAMADPGLLGRLASISVATLVAWGAADRIVPPVHGSAYAKAIPGARLELIEDAGHLPQLETPGRLLHDVWNFAAGG